MVEINLTQYEADALISIAKHRLNDERWYFPDQGMLSIPLISADKKEEFILDIRKARIDLHKGTYQNRARKVICLVRLDFGNKPHRNPDNTILIGSHLHLYREGYGHKWAHPIDKKVFTNINDLWKTLGDFMVFCNITRPPVIERGLFI